MSISTNEYFHITYNGTSIDGVDIDFESGFQVYYSTNGTSWSPLGGNMFTINRNQTRYFKGNGATAANKQFKLSRISDTVTVGGLCSSLITGGATQFADSCQQEFKQLFKDANTTLNFENNFKLGVKNVGNNACEEMFALNGVKNIPAGFFSGIESIGTEAFKSMFMNSKISSLPETLLPETDLAEGCYAEMFKGCTSITSIPAGFLPNENLAKNCYKSMFEGTKIQTVPEGLLCAKELVDGCYDSMFKNCTLLNTVYTCFKNWKDDLTYTPTLNWLSGVSASGDFYTDNNDLEEKRGTSYVPTEWTFHAPEVKIDAAYFTITYGGRINGKLPIAES